MIRLWSSGRVAIVALGVLACVSDAVAQQSGSSSTGADTYRTTLVLGANVDAGQGADPRGTSDTVGAEGLYTGGQFTLSFGKRLRRVAFGATAAKSLRYYRDGGAMNLGDSVGVTFDAQLFRHSRFTFGQSIRRMPFQQLLRFTDGISDPLALTLTSPDLSVLNAQTTTMTTVAGFGRPLGRRTDLQIRYGFDESRQGSRIDRRVFTFGGGIRRTLSRSFDLRLGQTLRMVRTEQNSLTPSLTAHDLDLGVDFHRALSFSRRTSVTFSSGAAAISTEGLTQYIVTGAAGLQHKFGRTWAAGATFDRRLNMIDGIPQPVVANGFTSTVGGLLGGDVGLRMRSSLMQGRLGLPMSRTDLQAGAGAAGFGTITTFTTEMRVLYTLWRGWQWYGEYFYYQHDLSNPGLLSPGVPASLQRNGVRTGVEFQTALVRRRR